MEVTWEQVPTAPRFGSIKPGDDCFTRILRYFELNWPIGLALNDRDPLADPVANDKIANP